MTPSTRGLLSWFAFTLTLVAAMVFQCAAQSGSSAKPAGPIDLDKRGGIRSWQPSAAPTSIVRAAQVALKQKGHDPGPIDGVLGPSTSAAVKAFQQSEGLPETGMLDRITRDRLGL